ASGGTPCGAAHRLAGKTAGFTGDRCSRQRIDELSDLDADLELHRRDSDSGFNRHSAADFASHSQHHFCHRRFDSGELWQTLSLSVDDPADQLNDEGLMSNDEG